MYAQLSAKILILTAGAAMLFFGIGLLGVAVATALAELLGTPGAYAVAGTILVLPVAVWAMVKNSHRAAPKPPPPHPLVGMLVSTIARETPLMGVLAAAATAAVTTATGMFLNRNKSRNK